MINVWYFLIEMWKLIVFAVKFLLFIILPGAIVSVLFIGAIIAVEFATIWLLVKIHEKVTGKERVSTFFSIFVLLVMGGAAFATASGFVWLLSAVQGKLF